MGTGHGTETNYLRVFMTQIRHKLKPEPSRPRYFLTEPGIGFRFALPDEGPAPDGRPQSAGSTTAKARSIA